MLIIYLVFITLLASLL